MDDLLCSVFSLHLSLPQILMLSVIFENVMYLSEQNYSKSRSLLKFLGSEYARRIVVTFFNIVKYSKN